MSFQKQQVHIQSVEQLEGKSKMLTVDLMEHKKANIVQQICSHLAEAEIL